jgi:hypothetical protein
VKHLSTSDSTEQSGGRPTSFKLVDSRIVGLTLINVLLYWLWRSLRSDYDRGIHRPDFVLFLAAATLWVWWQLLPAIASRISGWRQK